LRSTSKMRAAHGNRRRCKRKRGATVITAVAGPARDLGRAGR
jgi:hypothetical protein